MRVYAIPPFAFMAVYLCLALFYMLLYGRSRRADTDNLIFSVLSAMLAGYSYCCFRLYLADETTQGRFWLVAQFVFVIPAVPLLLHFFWSHLGIPRIERMGAVYAACAVFLALDLLTPYFFTHEPLVKEFSIAGMDVAYYEVATGPAGIAFLGVTIVVLGVILVWMMRARPDPGRKLGPLKWGYACLMPCIVNDVLVVSGVYEFIYLTEYGYFAFAISMAAVLLARYAALKNDLERVVAERTVEIERLAEALAQSERLAAAGMLAATLSHEVSNPLSVILTSLDILREEVPGGEGREILSSIRREVQKISWITRDLLNLARPRQEPVGPLDMNGIVSDFLLFYRGKLAAGAVTVESSLDRKCPKVGGHPGLVQQILLNLVKNAEEAMPSGGRIRIRTRKTDGGMRLEVEDSGPGIDPESASRIFEPFFTTKGSNGTGLGLFVTQGIVDSMGGAIEVGSPSGKGAIFRVFLPAAREEAGEAT